MILEEEGRIKLYLLPPPPFLDARRRTTMLNSARAGDKFGIGITITKRDGGVIGYGMSDLAYLLKEVIEVSPPETLLQIENNSIMSGLAWIGLSIPFFIAELTARANHNRGWYV